MTGVVPDRRSRRNRAAQADPPPMPASSAADRYAALRPVFAPRSIAVVGAKDSGTLFLGSAAVMQALERLRFTGDVFLVNRNGTPAFGRSATKTVSELGTPVDMAAMAVPAAAIEQLLPDLVESRVAGMTALASGFSETGAAGAALQQRIVDVARVGGMEIIGPNCLGFVNFVDRVGVWFSGLPQPIRQGSVAIVSQSGGVGDAIMEAAHNLGIGLSYLVTTGNEPLLAVADVLEYLVEDPSTTAIVVFAEALKKLEVFIRAARRARELGKAIIVLKAGSSPKGARNALSHTGSLVGDDAVTDAAFRQLDIIRVRSLEEALTTAHLVAGVGPIAQPGVGFVSLSGGACSIVADTATSRGLELPDFDSSTVAGLTEVAPPFAAIQNPFDVTGAADDFTFERVLGVVGRQPDIGVLAVMCNVPTHQSGATPDVAQRLASIGRGMSSVKTPTVLISQTAAHLFPVGRDAIAEAGIRIALPGYELGVQALERLSWWSARRSASDRPALAAPAPEEGPGDVSPLSEWASREILERAGVPMVPAGLVQSADEAVDAWWTLGGGPVAVKIVATHISHKSDVGGVVLGAETEHAVREATTSVLAAGAAAGPEPVEGVLISPMRSGGVELIVGIDRDPAWGHTLLVGAGGVDVETLRDTTVRVLPVDAEIVDEMLTELRIGPMLGGGRGRPAVDREALIAAILAVGEAAALLGDALESVEVNPLLASQDVVEGLDALVVTRV